MRVYSNFQFAALMFFLLGASAGAQQADRQLPDIVKLEMVIDGRQRELVTHIYRPDGPGPFPLVIYSHGRASARADRTRLQYPVPVGHANYWLRKGVGVVAVVRPGYGETGGADREDSFSRWSGSDCTSEPDFASVARNAREVVVATHSWALQQAWVRKDRILLEGQSVGGLTTVAASALNLPGVVGDVNFAGGAGGNPNGSPGKSCKPENLTRSYGEFGRLVKVASLWLYAENDRYWGAEAPRQWAEAFRAGGSDTQFIQTAPVEGHDGHQLLLYGGKMWSIPLDAFVKKVGLLSP
jgi:dienelactone hydrolase